MAGSSQSLVVQFRSPGHDVGSQRVPELFESCGVVGKGVFCGRDHAESAVKQVGPGVLEALQLGTGQRM